MYICDGNSTKKFTLYPPTRTITNIYEKEWIDDENDIQPLFTISTISEDSQILNIMENFESSPKYEHDQFQENLILNICHLGRCLLILWKNLVALQLIYFQGKH